MNMLVLSVKQKAAPPEAQKQFALVARRARELAANH